MIDTTPPQSPIGPHGARVSPFAHTDLDTYYAWVLGRAAAGGADAAECAATAARIVDGDPESWHAAWIVLAERVEAEGVRLAASGDAAGARAAFLRAATYHRAPLFLMRPFDRRFRVQHRRMQAAFGRAMALNDATGAGPARTGTEDVAVRFVRRRTLPGYFWRADDTGEPRPTLIVVGGIEMCAEDAYYMVAPTALSRGYHVMAVDLPGQGLNPSRGLVMAARIEWAVSAVVDDALSRPEVDLERLALYGFSWGGYIACKSAAYDSRIRAMVANPPMPDVVRARRARQAAHDRRDPVGLAVRQQMAWRMGLRVNLRPRDIVRRISKTVAYHRYGRADVSRIECPVLCLVGEDEPPATLEVARETRARLWNDRSELRVFTHAEGGATPCQVDNLPLANGVIFDWLDRVLQAGAPRVRK